MTSLVVFTGICLHNFPEGMAVYLSTLRGWSLGVTIALAIGMHNIPEGVVCIYYNLHRLSLVLFMQLQKVSGQQSNGHS